MVNNFTFNSKASARSILAQLGKDTISLILALIVALLFITAWSLEREDGFLHQLRSDSQLAFKPLYELGYNIFRPLRDLSGVAPQYSLTEIENILRENQQNQAALALAEETIQENERLKALLVLKDTYNLDSVGTRVIAKNYTGGKRTLLIDIGSDSGIAVGAPVLSAQGLIGSISAVFPTSAEVRLLTDINSALAVYCQSSRLEGIITGSSEGALYMNYISASDSQAISIGDSVLTSGNGGRFPKGLLIGTISDIDSTKGDFLLITVRPFIYSTNFEELIVLLTNPEAVIAANSTSNNTAGALD